MLLRYCAVHRVSRHRLIATLHFKIEHPARNHKPEAKIR